MRFSAPPRALVALALLCAFLSVYTLCARADGSYASANDPRVIVGLGASAEAPRVKITWPSGRVEEFANVAIDRYVTLREGTGK